MLKHLLKFLPSLALLVGLIIQCDFALKDPDSIELWLTLQQGGIAYPPGYSIYLTLNGALLSLIPFGSQTQLILLLIIQIILLTIALQLLKEKFRWSPLACWFIVASLLLFRPFVYAATHLEVYALQVFLGCSAIFLCDRSNKSGLFYFVMGLLVVHHSSSLFLCLILVIYKTRNEGLKHLHSIPYCLLPVIYNGAYLYWFGTQTNLRNQWYALDSFSNLMEFISAKNYAEFYITFPSYEQLILLLESFTISISPVFGLIVAIIFLLGIGKQKCYFLLVVCASQSVLLPFYSVNDLWTYLALPGFLILGWITQVFDKLSANLQKTLLLAVWILIFTVSPHRYLQYSQFEKSRIDQAIQLSRQAVPSLFIAKDNILSVQLHQSQLAAVALHRLMHPRQMEWLKRQVPSIRWPNWNPQLYDFKNDEDRFLRIFEEIKKLNPELRIYLDSEESQLNLPSLRGLNNGVWNQFTNGPKSSPIMWLLSSNPALDYEETQIFKSGNSIALLWQTVAPDTCFDISIPSYSKEALSTACTKGKQGSTVINVPSLEPGNYKIQLTNKLGVASDLFVQIIP